MGYDRHVTRYACALKQETRPTCESGLYAALCDVSAWLPKLKPAGHDGDEESGQCDEECQMCQYEAIEGRIQAAFDDHVPAPPDQPREEEA